VVTPFPRRTVRDALCRGADLGFRRLASRRGVGGTTSRLAGRWRLGAEGTLGGTTRTGGAWTASSHAIGEPLWSAPRCGLGLGVGPSTGWIANDTTRFVALHTRARLVAVG
jgi:hypothetical protein